MSRAVPNPKPCANARAHGSVSVANGKDDVLAGGIGKIDMGQSVRICAKLIFDGGNCVSQTNFEARRMPIPRV